MEFREIHTFLNMCTKYYVHMREQIDFSAMLSVSRAFRSSLAPLLESHVYLDIFDRVKVQLHIESRIKDGNSFYFYEAIGLNYVTLK